MASPFQSQRRIHAETDAIGQPIIPLFISDNIAIFSENLITANRNADTSELKEVTLIPLRHFMAYTTSPCAIKHGVEALKETRRKALSHLRKPKDIIRLRLVDVRLSST